MSVRNRALVMSAVAVVLSSPSVATAQFVNGGFESTPLPSGLYGNYYGGDSFAGWDVVGTAVSALATTYSEPGNGVAGGTQLFNAHSGNVSFDMTGPYNNGLTAGLRQSVVTTAGLSYEIAFWVGKATGDYYYTTPSTVDVSIDGGARVSFTNANYNPNVLDWKRFTTTFVATSASTQVTFYNGTLDNAMVGLDDVSIAEVTATPEPASLLLLGTGLSGLCGVAGRRKR